MNDISILVRKMCVYAERNMADEKLGFPEQIVLMYLHGQGPSTQDQMATYFELDKGAISKTLNKMEEKGLIVRETNAADKRQKIVTLTGAGRSILGRMTEVLTSWNEQVFAGVPHEEVAMIEKNIALMAKNANKLVGGER